jgi:hypothetical protein
MCIARRLLSDVLDVHQGFRYHREMQNRFRSITIGMLCL